MKKLLVLVAALACSVSAPALAQSHADGTLDQILTQLKANANGGGGGASADSPSSGSLPAATANGAYTINVAAGQNTAVFAVAGLAASGATLIAEASNDNGGTWGNIYTASGLTGMLSNTFTADGGFSLNVAGRTKVRLRVSVPGSGTIMIASNLSVAVRDIGIDKPLPAGSNTLGAVLTPYDASFTFAPAGGSSESSSAASYTFSAASQAAARGWYSNCPANTTLTVTLNGINGGTKQITLYDGPYGPVSERITGFSGNTAACTIGVEF